MLRLAPFAALLATALLALSCSDTVLATEKISTRHNPQYIDDFPSYETFSVVTEDLVDTPEDLPELGDEQQAFNEYVNGLIVDAMTSEPVCLDYIRPEDVTEENQPDLWAANGLARSTQGGYVYECCGGWWWGYWGWYWDPCAFWCPTYVEFDVGSLFIPVGFPVASGVEPELVFAGLAQAISDGQGDREKVERAVQEIFKQWPIQNSCPEQ